eukprot:scaffold3066_cov131-Skeletonema_menzelii.AAC.14
MAMAMNEQAKIFQNLFSWRVGVGQVARSKRKEKETPLSSSCRASNQTLEVDVTKSRVLCSIMIYAILS